jgi:hypothetical protein
MRQCNEAKPICAGCIKHETPCDYPSAEGSSQRMPPAPPPRPDRLILPSLLTSTADSSMAAAPHGIGVLSTGPRQSLEPDPTTPLKRLGSFNTEDITLVRNPCISNPLYLLGGLLLYVEWSREMVSNTWVFPVIEMNR